MISENYPISFREGFFTINRNKWSTGGLNANYHGILKAKNMGYKYIFGLSKYYYLSGIQISKKIDIH